MADDDDVSTDDDVVAEHAVVVVAAVDAVGTVSVDLDDGGDNDDGTMTGCIIGCCDVAVSVAFCDGMLSVFLP